MHALETHFRSLDDFLQQWQWLWREPPFKYPSLSWFASHPQWKAVMDALPDARLDQLAGDVDALYAFARQQLNIDIDPRYYRVDSVASAVKASGGTHPDGIGSRKWQQICAFSDAYRSVRNDDAKPGDESATDIVEWCAGKGHLSRLLLQRQLCNGATGLEWDDALIDSGNIAARRDNLALHLQQQDVLDDSVKSHCTTQSHHIALHACGKLHLSMLRHCSEAQVQGIDLVPCCYHKIDEAIYQPLSAQARQSTLQLDQEALKLALQETVTAPANARRHRERLQCWRLGFDALQRESRGVDEYLPVPSMANAAHSRFDEFCVHCAGLKQIELPADIARFEAIGHRRFREVSRYDLIRQLFRRPIELWLALDRCLYLTERGYDVALAEFCSRELTPRNLWIHARLRG